MAAYAKHADVLGRHDKGLDAFMQKTLAQTLDNSLSVPELVNLTLETGKAGVTAMALLDAANTGAYGHPEITTVDLGVGNRPASSSPATTCATWKCCWSRPRARAWTFTPTARCCRPLLSGLQEIQPLQGQLRQCLVAAEGRV